MVSQATKYFRARQLWCRLISVAAKYPQTKERIERKIMKSTPIRNPEKDIMLAPGNAALILIDYQPPQVSTVESIDRRTLISNVVALSKTAELFDLPIILSTVNVSNGVPAEW
jgi:hypothetical protein